MNKKDNIIWFFLLALALHLSLFLIKERGVKGDAPLTLKSNSAPISVKVKSIPMKKQTVDTDTTPVKSITEKKIVEEKRVVEKKESLKPEVKSKIKDKKKTPIEKTKREKLQKNLAEKTEKIEKNTQERKKRKENNPSNTDILSNKNFNIDRDGVFTASSSEGIEYKILKQVDPDYPSQAERVRYRKKVIISVRFLVGLNGRVEKIDFIQSHSKLGFDAEVRKALNQWVFHPIYYKNKNIKVYFTKDFIFEPKI